MHLYVMLVWLTCVRNMLLLSAPLGELLEKGLLPSVREALRMFALPLGTLGGWDFIMCQLDSKSQPALMMANLLFPNIQCQHVPGWPPIVCIASGGWV